ncbi:MAG: hypothetical protein HY668_00325 [Chloroflexi bacterium]|nr:hypothetical protein [Chloroflexota bacterium]
MATNRTSTKTASSRVTWVWGDRDKGIALVRSPHKMKNGRYDYDIHHVKDGKTVLVHRNYSKTEGLREARSYADYEKKHPRIGFLKLG